MARYDTQVLYDFDVRTEREFLCRVVGLDEAGRGPLAGPVVAAAVILDLDRPIAGIFDSKQLSPKKRNALYDRITSEAPAWAVGQASVEEIDRLNILVASLTAMKRALDCIKVSWSLALVDGNQAIPSIEKSRQHTVVAGDAASASIAAASIVAKVTRDRLMVEYHEKFPGYGFLLHKGYGTAVHRDKIRELGLCEIHRRSFCRSSIAPAAKNGSHCALFQNGNEEKEAR
jgi:ribonuclease HII